MNTVLRKYVLPPVGLLLSLSMVLPSVAFARLGDGGGRGGGGVGGGHHEARSVNHNNRDIRSTNVRNSSVTNVNSRRVNNNNVNINKNVNVNVNSHHHGGGWDDDYHPIATAAAVTATVAVTSAVIGSIVRTVPANCVPVNYSGMVYQQCGTAWYQPQYVGTQVQYIVVNPPY